MILMLVYDDINLYSVIHIKMLIFKASIINYYSSTKLAKKATHENRF